MSAIPRSRASTPNRPNTDPTHEDPSLADVFVEPPHARPSTDRIRRLVEEHRRFLTFLERRLGDRALAEDVLQDAFAKTLGASLPAASGVMGCAHHPGGTAVSQVVGTSLATAKVLGGEVSEASEGSPLDEALLAWFYRVLKNAVIDQQRRLGARQRSLDRLAEALDHAPVIAELEREACRCVLSISENLRPEYAEALRRIELDGVAVKDFARDKGITPQNAATRVFRARRALERELARACGTCATHGCFDCTCAEPPPTPEPQSFR